MNTPLCRKACSTLLASLMRELPVTWLDALTAIPMAELPPSVPRSFICPSV